MTDYLSGLAARALGVATVVRPRPAARFEPQPVEEPERLPTPSQPKRVADRRTVAAAPTARPRKPVGATTQREDLATPTAPPANNEVEPAPMAEAPPVSRSSDITTAARVREPDTQSATPEMQVQRRPRRAVHSARPTASEAEPPSVHVTIGRIEVRAVAPPAPATARPSARHPSPLSLDEYLELRRSGRR
jgi:hypothetical protein